MNILHKTAFSLFYSFFLVLLFIIPTALWGAEEPQEMSLRGSTIATNATLNVADSRFGTSTWSTQTAYGVENFVRFEIDFDNTANKYFHNLTFSATCKVKIVCYGNPNDPTAITKQFDEVNLQVNYNPAAGASYKGIDNFKFDGAFRVDLTVLSLTSSGIAINNYPIFKLTNKLVVTRQYQFSDLPDPSEVIKYSTDGIKLNVSWLPTHFPGAELFDLEWTYVDEQSGAGNAINTAKIAGQHTLTSDQLEYFFKNNSSRVTLAGSQYQFNLNYNKGFVLFRIRGVQFRHGDDLRLEGAWLYRAQAEPSSIYNFFEQGIVDVDWHEQGMNWQYNAVYAEEGKKKEVINYFDGTLRSRQTVTQNNEDSVAVVAEPVYDALGRSAISILPTPVSDHHLKFFPLFNLNKNALATPLSYKDLSYVNCILKADSLSPMSGAGLYYSTNNPFQSDATQPWHKAIAKAEGYPLAVTQYTPDNTGRIRAQGGVGVNFQLGSGHETRYFYGKPLQYELDRLFGAEAGDHTRYLKNMVIDANGQVSVSYLNSDGKTVATALAGIPPANLDPLSTASAPSNLINDILLTPSSFHINASRSSLEATATFLVSGSGDHKFTYRFSPEQYQEGYNNQSQTLCYTCSYDLLITLKDECGAELLKEEINKVSPFNTSCTPPAEISKVLNAYIGAPGEYTVHFELLINKQTLDAYTTHYLNTNTDIKKLSQFLLEQLVEENMAECYNDCEACKSLPATQQEFVDQVKAFYTKESISFGTAETQYAENLYTSIKYNCTLISQQCVVSPCDEVLAVILSDVSPGGQYAEYDDDFELVDPEINVLVHYKDVQYVNADNSPMLVEDESGNMVSPSALSLKEFIQKFDERWAVLLAPYHPEYCNYTWCTMNSEGKLFNQRVQDLNDPVEAKTQGLFQQSNPLTLLVADPFFAPTGKGASYYSEMQADLNSYSARVLGMTGQTPKSILGTIDYLLYCGNMSPGVPWSSCTKGISDPCRSVYKEWLMYKEWYLARKEKYYQLAMKTELPTCSNCFIPSSNGADPTAWTTCVAPPLGSFSVSEVVNSAADGLKRIVIQYKDGNEAVQWPLMVGLVMRSSATNTVMHQPVMLIPGSGKQELLVSMDFDVFELEGVNCAQISQESNGGETVQASSTAVEPATNSSFEMSASNLSSLTNFSCPDDQFYYDVKATPLPDTHFTELKLCYSGPAIPDGHLVHVVVSYSTAGCGDLQKEFTLCASSAGCETILINNDECGEITNHWIEQVICTEEPCEIRCPLKEDFVVNYAQLPDGRWQVNTYYTGVPIPERLIVPVEVTFTTPCGDMTYTIKFCAGTGLVNTKIFQDKEVCGGIFDPVVRPGTCYNGLCEAQCPAETNDFTTTIYQNVDGKWEMQTCYTGLPIPTGTIIPVDIMLRTPCGEYSYKEEFCSGKGLCRTRILSEEEVCNGDFAIAVVPQDCFAGNCTWMCPDQNSFSTDFNSNSDGQWEIRVCYTGEPIPEGKVVQAWVSAHPECTSQSYLFTFTSAHLECKVKTFLGSESCGSIGYLTIESVICSDLGNEAWQCPVGMNYYTIENIYNELTKQWEVQTSYTGPAIPYNKTVILPVSITGCSNSTSYEIRFCQGMTRNTHVLTNDQSCGGSFTITLGETYCLDAPCSGNCPEASDFSTAIVVGGSNVIRPGYQFSTIVVSHSSGVLNMSSPLERVKVKLEVVTRNVNTGKTYTGTVYTWFHNDDSFKNVGFTYLINREILRVDVKEIVCSGACRTDECCDGEQYGLYEGKVRRFYQYVAPDFNAVQTTYFNGNTNFSVYPVSMCKNECEMMADSWIAQLSGCSNDVVKLEQVRRKLIEVCQQSCVAQQGNISVSTYSDVNPTPSFEGVIAEVFGTGFVSICGYDLISDPYPWGKKPIVEKTFATETDSKICTRLMQLKTEAQSKGYTTDVDGVHQYLSTYYQPYYNLDQEELSDLFTGCWTCNNIIPLPVELPAFMEGNAKPCKSCNEYAALVAQFHQKYPYVTSSDSKYEVLFRNFLNHQTGYSYAYANYADFELKCGQQAFHDVGRLCETPLQMEVTIDPLSQCMEEKFYNALANASVLYASYIEEVRRTCRNNYTSRCLSTQPQLELEAKVYEYHYTLYYYDQSGNLVKTVPPKGVAFLSASDLAALRNDRTLPLVPPHQLATVYLYNSFNQVVEQSSPDGGTSYFWYDNLGRLVASQNEEQRSPDNGGMAGRYSFTKYEPILGRITEVGEKWGAGGTMVDTKDPVALNSWLSSGTDKDITQTLYDRVNLDIVTNPNITHDQQDYTSRKRVVASIFKKERYTMPYDYDAATHYSYDVNGNAKIVWQESRRLYEADAATEGLKRLDYDFDLVSGKVNRVWYQRGKGDQFIYKYDYDPENRLKEVLTSRDGQLWHNDATYRYYLHGPLARTELGRLKVQGMDYAYTLQGWLKYINGPVLQEKADIAGDGDNTNTSTNLFKRINRDVMSYGLSYFDGDYKPVAGGSALAFAETLPITMGTGKELFNGNIRATTMQVLKLGDPVTYSYGYDQLNRLKRMRRHDVSYTVPGEGTGASFAVASPTDAYGETISYDANGNIMSYLRNGSAARLSMDNLSYHYKDGKNQLDYVDEDDAIASTNYMEDIDDGQTAGNYQYDKIGNLIKDIAEHLDKIEWTVYGKIRKITKTDAAQTVIEYEYDAAGNRIYKKVTAGGTVQYTYYVRDAQGNTLAVYTRAGNTSPVQWSEQHLYGSSRLGMVYVNSAVPQKVALPEAGGSLQEGFEYGKTVYELGNHLGNVLATVSDKKVGVETGTTGLVDHYTAEVVTAQDYYPFGMILPGRTYSAGNGYRYGFNGKENDNEVKGEGNQQDYGMRIYDPRLGKFLSVDPLSIKYPMLSPYQFASNSPIAGIDLDGLEFYFAADGRYLGQSKNGGTQIRVATEYHVNPNNKSQIIFTKYNNIEQVDAATATKVYTTIYKREVRNPHSSGVSASEETSGNAFAGTDPVTKHITVYFKQSMQSEDGTKQKLMTDYYNTASILNHEDDHAAGLNSNGFDHFRIGIREAVNKFQTKVSRYYKENLMNNMRGYLRDQVNAILTFKDKGDSTSEAFYRTQYERNLKTFNRLFGQNDKSFFEVVKEKPSTKKLQNNP